MSLKSILRFILIIFVLTLTPGCSSDKSGDGPIPDNMIKPTSESFEGTTRENTEAVPMETMRSLQSYDSETGTYVFSSDGKDLMELEAGKVVLFEGHSLRKIKSVAKEGKTYVVNSEFARLTDYYKDAKISYKAAVNWSEDDIAATRIITGTPMATMIRPMAMAANGSQQTAFANVKTKIQGWDVNLKISPGDGGKLKIELGAGKGNVCSINAIGHLSSFESTANIDISEGVTQNFTYRNEGMEGELEVKFAAVGLGSEIAILQIPATLERTILVYGFIPVTLRLKANLKIYPEVAVGSSSQVSMKLTYNTNSGFTYDAGRVTSIGGLTGHNAEQTGDSNTATPAIAGMGVGIEFPRFEIGILGNLVVPYMVFNTHTSSYLSTGLAGGALPCHMAQIKYNMQAGVSMSFLGVATINNNYKLFEKEKKWVADGSRCDE